MVAESEAGMGKKVAVGQWGVCPLPRGRKSFPGKRWAGNFFLVLPILYCIVSLRRLSLTWYLDPSRSIQCTVQVLTSSHWG